MLVSPGSALHSIAPCLHWLSAPPPTHTPYHPQAQDLPVYFGDAGSPAVLHLVGAERAACAVIALDTPGGNYRAVWAMAKHFPHVKVMEH